MYRVPILLTFGKKFADKSTSGMFMTDMREPFYSKRREDNPYFRNRSKAIPVTATDILIIIRIFFMSKLSARR